jgi:hypothetical protein
MEKLPAKDGEPTTKEVAGMNYHWCIHHMAWGIHSLQECRLGASRKDAPKDGPKDKVKDKAMIYVAAAATIANPSFATFLSKLLEDEE